MSPFVLLAVGLFMIFLEFYLPGGVMGVLGGLVILASIIIFAMQSDSGFEVILFITGTLIAVILLFRFALWRIRHGPEDGGIYSGGAQEGYFASSFDREAIGKKGTVVTDLRPGGHVMVEGKKHGAISQSGYISKGEAIVVIDGQGESLIVRRVKD